eukprot:CAMPEP_0203806074 /NCGR_PEP_ID=MMETSP0100_2-20121128/14618_1 /ASSEMBLY_ACC=CAM_ASM_000210 /TAXON_ID=96639 /ORGANISM=" , Strain NY0313808BC1" /LENGTH=226 /DNA_ID=CAMNT_0050714723 /DNA_START=435 /DNA_END=1111 /DNA_ORIENTATION=+
MKVQSTIAAAIMIGDANATSLRKQNTRVNLRTNLPHLSATQNRLLIVNNCKNHTVYWSSESTSDPQYSQAIPEDYLTGNDAGGHSLYEPNFRVSSNKDWHDISFVNGFNVGISVQVLGYSGSSPKAITAKAHNSPDAFMICDTAVTNEWAPNWGYGKNANLTFKATFCPDEEPDTTASFSLFGKTKWDHFLKDLPRLGNFATSGVFCVCSRTDGPKHTHRYQDIYT